MHVSRTTRAGTIAGVVALAGALLLPSPANAADAPVVLDDPITFTTGHIDAFNLALNADDSVQLNLKEDVTGSHVQRTPESVTLAVKSQAAVANIPAGAVPAGLPEDFHLLPLTQDYDLIWPGWDSQGIASVYGANAKIDINVTNVSGPGEVYLWSQGGFGTPTQIIQNSWKLPGTIHQNFTSHVHSNWGFTQPGSYGLTVQASVASADGTKTSTTNVASYSFEVFPAPTALSISGAETPVADGAELTLSAAQTPASSTFSDYAWFTRASDGDDWQEIAGEAGASITVAAAQGAQYRATISGGQDIAKGSGQPIVVESSPVTVAIEAPVEQTVSLAPLAGHYHSGSPVDLVATATPAVEGATYAWYLQRSDQDEPVRIAGVSGATHRLTAEQALHGATVTAELLGADGASIARTAAVTIEVDDHGSAPLQKVSITGLADEYEVGADIALTASVAPASVLDRFEWYVQVTGSTEPVLVEGENGPTVTMEATDELAGAAVIAKLTYSDGTAYVESAPAIVTIADQGEEIPETDLTITTSRDADDYFVGQTATLTAVQSVPTGLATYQWYTKLPGAESFTAVEGQTSASYAFKPTLANSGIQVRVELVDGERVHAASEPVTITAEQLPATTVLTVAQDKATYVAGDVAHFESTQTPQTPQTEDEHYHWYIKRAGAADYVWVDQSREKDLDLPVTVEDDGAQLVIRLFDHDHAVLAESAPVTLAVEPVATEPEPVDTVLSIDGLVAAYDVGDVAALSAVQTPETGEDHYHWFIKRSADADYAMISGALSADLAYTIAEGDQGASIMAKLYNHDHAVIAESEPVVLSVRSGEAKPADAPESRTGEELDGVEAGGITLSDTTPERGQVITVQLGDDTAYAGQWAAAWLFSEPTLLGGDWVRADAQGRIAVTIPADATTGEHRLAVFDADGALIGWDDLVIAAAADVPGDGDAGDADGDGVADDTGDGDAGDGLAVTGGEAVGLLSGASLLLLMGAAALVVMKRRRSSAAAE
ncbi:choice-of-anchor M domain-containing protein [Labedella endophytica]|uniref:Gram-positive cocci surface proteins LPxTG domain-containing protein n=1 Tax=Labedella endophytica TaxID=1523160 RepID=A0A433JX56_9MICO|nr:choice-of-anchor M domain-containing protein [Labedella endophytica]RUR03543.1 hypothetical protein ELQ94_03160 [Labedella endophytica]